MWDDTANRRPKRADEQRTTAVPDGGKEMTVRGRDDGRATWVLNSLVLDRVTTGDTGGRYSITEHHAHPAYVTPYHRHRGEDEVVHVTAGEFTVYTDDATHVATAGDTVVIPRGLSHALRVTGDEPAEALVVCSPAGFEEFFHEVGEPAAERRVPDPAEPDLEQVEALAPEYDLDLLGPPPE